MSAHVVHVIAPGRHLALVEEEIVILDLSADRYSALAPQFTPAVLSLLSGGESSPDTEAVATNLVEAGIITDASLAPHPAFIAMPANGAMNAERMLAAPWLVGLAIQALGKAKKMFRGASIGQLTAGDRAVIRDSWSARDLARAKALIEAFELVRPFSFQPRLCLFDAFALRVLFGDAGLKPSWIFGVKLAPFSAHCWLQAGDIVLNDDLDHVRLYQPILVV